MRFIRRLMEIKEEQLKLESLRTFEIMRINSKVSEILKLLKGGVKDGKRIRTSNRKASRISKKARN